MSTHAEQSVRNTMFGGVRRLPVLLYIVPTIHVGLHICRPFVNVYIFALLKFRTHDIARIFEWSFFRAYSSYYPCSIMSLILTYIVDFKISHECAPSFFKTCIHYPFVLHYALSHQYCNSYFKGYTIMVHVGLLDTRARCWSLPSRHWRYPELLLIPFSFLSPVINFRASFQDWST